MNIQYIKQILEGHMSDTERAILREYRYEKQFIASRDERQSWMLDNNELRRLIESAMSRVDIDDLEFRISHAKSYLENYHG